MKGVSIKRRWETVDEEHRAMERQAEAIAEFLGPLGLDAVVVLRRAATIILDKRPSPYTKKKKQP